MYIDVLLVTWLNMHIDNAYRLGIVKLNKSFIRLQVSYVASVYKASTKDLYSDGCLHDNLEGESYYSFQTLKKLGPGCEVQTTSHHAAH